MTDDLVKQLRFTADDVCRCGTPVCLEAADLIEKLEEEIGVLFAANVRLNSRADLDSDGYVDRINKLEAALRPFAKWADWHDDAKGTDVERCFSKAQITVGELRAARKALEGKDD
jgi:hypothetical protein